MYDNVKRASSILFTVSFLGDIYFIIVTQLLKYFGNVDFQTISSGSPINVIGALSCAGTYLSLLVFVVVSDTHRGES